MLQANYVPTIWRNRIMALIPKTATSRKVNEFRPIMLLDTLRKEVLSIIRNRILHIILNNKLLHPSQKGGLPNSGTEDAILPIQNAIEDAHEEQKTLHILSYDKKKAFDSPYRNAGLYMAYRRIGIPHEYATFLINCDVGAKIYPKTPLLILNPELAEGFEAANGVAQGDSPSGLHYNLIEDIVLEFLAENPKHTDTYYIRDSQGILRPQPPLQFVDDLYTVHNSTRGATAMLHKLRVTGTILNINLNPDKCKHLRIVYEYVSTESAPDRSERVLQSNDRPPELFTTLPNGTIRPIQIVPHDTPCRILGAYLLTGLATQSLTAQLYAQTTTIKKTLLAKKATSNDVTSALYRSVFPSVGYIMQFGLLSPAELNKIAAPLRDATTTKTRTKLFAHAITFCNDATPYGGKHKCLADFTNSRKYSIQQRLNSGDPLSQIVMQSLLHRTSRQLASDNILPSNAWINTPLVDTPDNKWVPSNFGNTSTNLTTDPGLTTTELRALREERQPVRALNTWGESLVEFLQQGNCNLATKYHPHAPVGTGHTTDGGNKPTATPLIDIYNTEDPSPAFTRTQWADFLIQYDLLYVEELWGLKLNPDTQEYDLDADTIHKVINPHFSAYIRSLQNTWQNANISHGHIMLRRGLFLTNPNNDNSVLEITGLAVDVNLPNTNGNIDIHGNEWSHTESTRMEAMAGDITLLSIARNKREPERWRKRIIPATQNHNFHHPRLLTGPENESNTTSQYNGQLMNMLVYYPTAQDLNAHHRDLR